MKTKFSQRTKKIIFLALGVIAVCPLTVFAATTIGNNISTTGNLIVNGNVQFTLGAAAGRVLTSDAAGNATWSALPAETDPVFSASAASGITGSDIANWNTAYGWGNHATAGYLTSETDPVFGASPASGILAGDIANWNTAYGWGNHAAAGYLTSESDPAAVLKAIFTSNGDLIYGTGAGTYTRLGIGSAGQFLTVSGGVPSWTSIPVLPSGTTNNSILRYDTGSSTWQENTNILASSTGSLIIAAGQSYTGLGAVTLSSGAGAPLTIIGNAASSWTTTAGNLTLDAGSGIISFGDSTDLITNGPLTITTAGGSPLVLNSGSGSLVLDTGTNTIKNTDAATDIVLESNRNIKIADNNLLVLGSKNDPDPSGVNGSIYYNTTNNKFRCYENGAWKDCITSTVANLPLSGLTAAVAANTINNGDNAQIWNWSITSNNTAGLNLGENIASTGTGTSILKISSLTSSTALPLFIDNRGDGESFRVNDSASDTTPFLIDENGNVAIGSDFFDPAYPEKLKVDAGVTSSYNIISGYGNVNNYLQLNIRNRNSGNNASSDVVATSDTGNETQNYIDMGINSSGYNNPAYSIGGPNDGYLYTMGVDALTPGGNLLIGTATEGKVIKFHVGGTTASDEVMRIDGNGRVGIGTTSPSYLLDVAGDIKVGDGSLLILGQKASADPVGINGAMYYNTTVNRFKCYEDGAWVYCGTNAPSTTSLQDAYVNGATIITAGATPIAFTLTSGDFNVSGAGSVNLTPTGASQFTSSGSLTLTAGAASTWGTSAGNLSLQAAGTGTTANIQIGAGGAGSGTPDLLVLDIKSDAGDPAGTNGAMYYNDNMHKFRCYVNGSWVDCDTTGGTVTLQSAYNNGSTITTAGSTDIDFILTSGDFNVSGAGSVNLTPTGASQFTSSGSLTLTAGAASTWGTSAGNLSLQAAGTDTTANIQIGVGGAGSGTPDLLALDVKSTAGDPAGFSGAMYYNAYTDTFRCYEAGGWKDCGNTGTSTGTLQQAYNAGATITTASNVPIAFTLTSGDFNVSGAGSVNLTPTGASQFTSSGSLTLTAGAASTWSTSAGTLTIDSAAGLNLGTINATGLTLGKSGITTTNLGPLQLGSAALAGSLKIADGSNNYITIVAPGISADYTLTLPTTAGSSGQAIVTDGSGNLSWLTVLGDPMTTRGDLIYRDATNTTARLAIGSAGQVLRSDGTDIGWATLTASDVGLGNVTNDAQIPKSIGLAKGDLIVYTASNTPVRLPVGGTNGWVLTVDSTQVGGVKWAAITPSANSLDFTEFKDIMTLDANTSIAMNNWNLTINDVGGSGALTLAPGGALTLTAGSASTWSTSTGALTITSASAATWGTSAGNLSLQAAGAGTTANIQIGAGGAGSGTPDLLVLDIKSTAGDPTGTNGAVYYNSNTGKFRCYQAGAWTDCIAAGSLPSGTTTNSTLRWTGSNWAENINLLVDANGAIQIGGGTAIKKHLSNTASWDFGLIGNNSCLSTTITVNGASPGDTVVATPTPVAGGIETFTSTHWHAYVSAANTVTIRVCKMGTTTVDPANQTWRVDVWQH